MRPLSVAILSRYKKFNRSRGLWPPSPNPLLDRAVMIQPLQWHLQRRYPGRHSLLRWLILWCSINSSFIITTAIFGKSNQAKITFHYKMGHVFRFLFKYFHLGSCGPLRIMLSRNNLWDDRCQLLSRLNGHSALARMIKCFAEWWPEYLFVSLYTRSNVS